MNKLNKTFYPDQRYLTSGWYSIDCKGQQLGRLATLVTTLLRGKRKSYYHPSSRIKDKIILLNTDLIKINPSTQHYLVNNPGRPGSSLKIKKDVQEFRKFNIETAVKGMLSATEVKYLLGNLYIYSDGSHPHIAQEVVEVNLKSFGFKID